MINNLKEYLKDIAHLFFPHLCIGCDSDALDHEAILCVDCYNSLPETGFLSLPGNIVEKKLYGRLNVCEAGSPFYFTQHSLMQRIIHELKYKGNKKTGIFLGKLLGKAIKESNRFKTIDCVIPMPINEKRLRQRGYNQSEIIAKEVALSCNLPLNTSSVIRPVYTETQTHKGRTSRWQTMAGAFAIVNEKELEGRHVLLIDDIITTGATLENCGQLILQIPGTRLSIATVAVSV